MKTTSLLFRFSEPDGIWPSDATGNLDDLHTEPGINAPTSVDAWTGKGRQFARVSSQALLGSDLAGKDTLLQRDVTIQALLKLTLTGNAGPHTIIARGLNDGSISERYCYGLELEEQASYPGYVEVRMFWQDGAGNIKTQPPGVFRHPGDGKEFLLTATRRWEASNKVVCRYYVDYQMLAEIETSDGDISGGTTGRVTVGARKAAGVWGRFLNGVIDELFVDEAEMSPEEVRQIWLRLTEHQPAGVAHFAGLVPKGLSWARNLGNSIGKRVKVTGQLLGLVRAAAEEMRALWLPNKCPASFISEWEDLCGLSPKPGDSLETRQKRLASYLSREEGFSHPAIRVALEELLDPPELADIELLEYDNFVNDEFTTLDLDTKWLKGDVGSWTTPGGVLHLNVAAGTDLRPGVVGNACHVRIPLDTGDGAIYVSSKIGGYAAIPASTGVGMLLENRVTGHALWFGIRNDAGVLMLGWMPIVSGVVGAFNVLATPVAGDYWLRAETVDLVTGSWKLSWSTAGVDAGFASSTIVAGVLGVQWAGFGAWSDIAAPAGPIDVDFDLFHSYTPDGERSFAWYAYRDPAKLGSPDIPSARLTVLKIKPAHTFGGVAESKKVLAGDPRFGMCGFGPCAVW